VVYVTVGAHLHHHQQQQQRLLSDDVSEALLRASDDPNVQAGFILWLTSLTQSLIYKVTRIAEAVRTCCLKMLRNGGVAMQGHASNFLQFWPLNANSSKTVKATDFKLDVHVPRDGPVMTP